MFVLLFPLESKLWMLSRMSVQLLFFPKSRCLRSLDHHLNTKTRNPWACAKQKPGQPHLISCWAGVCYISLSTWLLISFSIQSIFWRCRNVTTFTVCLCVAILSIYTLFKVNSLWHYNSSKIPTTRMVSFKTSCTTIYVRKFSLSLSYSALQNRTNQRPCQFSKT